MSYNNNPFPNSSGSFFEEPVPPAPGVQTIEVQPQPVQPVQPVQPQPVQPQAQRKPRKTETVPVEEVEKVEEIEVANFIARPWMILLPAIAAPIIVGWMVSPRGLGTMPKQVDGVTPPLAGLVGWLISPLGVGLGLTVLLLVAIYHRNHTATTRIALLVCGYLIALGLSSIFANVSCPIQ